MYLLEEQTMNIKRHKPIQKVLSFLIKKQLEKPRKKDENFRGNTSFTEFNISSSYQQRCM
jgi:hypothetical protein